jgi:hypothetical protein
MRARIQKSEKEKTISKKGQIVAIPNLTKPN